MAGTAAFGPRVADELVLSIVNERTAARSDARAGTFGRPMHVVAATNGMAFMAERSAVAYRWGEVRDIALRRGSVVVKTESVREVLVPKDGHSEVRRFMEQKTRAFRLVVDDVAESALSGTFVRVLEEMRDGSFSVNGTAWHEYQNALERLEEEFSYQDDHVLPVAAGGLWLALGLITTVVVSIAMNVAAARSVPPDTFTLSHRTSALDPRSIVAGFAASVLLTRAVLRLGLGHGATVWIRGAARGWHRARSSARQWVVRLLGRVLLSSSTAAAILLLALLTFWPTIATTVLIDARGVRHEVLLPFVSLDEPWRDVMQIERVASGDDPNDRAGVRIRFLDGRDVSTAGNDLGGGTEGQLYEVALRWWKAAER